MAGVNGTGRASTIRWRRRWNDRFGVQARRPVRPFAEELSTEIPAPEWLVPLEPVAGRREPARRPAAAFVAQLLAARLDLPQSRETGRAGPDEAEARYHASSPDGQATRRGSLVRRDI